MTIALLTELGQYVREGPQRETNEVEPPSLEEVLTPYVNLHKSLTIGVEADAAKHVTSKIGKVTEEHLDKMARHYFRTTLDTSFLTMRSDAKYQISVGYILDTRDIKTNILLPRFAVYSLDSPECVIRIETILPNGGRLSAGQPSTITPNSLPNLLKEPFLKAVIVSIPDEYYSYRQYGRDERQRHDFTSRFGGIIPRRIKETLPIARQVFGEQIYLITESKDWKCQTTAIPTASDPLLVGIRDRTCFLVSEFDTTTMEEYVKREFTEKGLGK